MPAVVIKDTFDAGLQPNYQGVDPNRPLTMDAFPIGPGETVQKSIQFVARRAGRFDENTGTSFYDAIYLACAESPIAEVTGTGRKAVVVFSDCIDSTSSYRFDQITDAVERSGASVYVLLFDTKGVTDRLLTSARGYGNRINFSVSQLERFYDNEAAELDVQLCDNNGPKGGEDKECRVTAFLPGSSPIHVTEVSDNLYKSVDLARDRLERLTKRELEKRRSPTGHGMDRPLGRVGAVMEARHLEAEGNPADE